MNITNNFLRRIPTIHRMFISNIFQRRFHQNKHQKYLPIRNNSQLVRGIHASNGKFQIPKTPDLIYFPHIRRWLRTKMQFKYLKRFWDPTFSEGAFIYGSTQAICRITEIINNNKISELDGLLTPMARMKLIDDMKRKLTPAQKRIIKITPKDIKILVPMSVQLNRNQSNKHCKIAMRTLALKWCPHQNGYFRLVLVALQSEFMKNYTQGTDGDWDICKFDIMDCSVLTEISSSNRI